MFRIIDSVIFTNYDTIMSKVVSKEEMSALMNATAPKDQADSKESQVMI